MNSRISKYIIGYMMLNGIKSTEKLAKEAGVGWHWFRRLYADEGRGNPQSIPLQSLHDHLVCNYGMLSVINVPDESSNHKNNNSSHVANDTAMGAASSVGAGDALPPDTERV